MDTLSFYRYLSDCENTRVALVMMLSFLVATYTTLLFGLLTKA